jgi:hypothetical protein
VFIGAFPEDVEGRKNVDCVIGRCTEATCEDDFVGFCDGARHAWSGHESVSRGCTEPMIHRWYYPR